MKSKTDFYFFLTTQGLTFGMFVFCGFMMRFLLRDVVWMWLGSDKLEGLVGLTDLQYKHTFIEHDILLYSIFLKK